MTTVALPSEREAPAPTWAERNQLWLSRRFAYWRTRLEAGDNREERDASVAPYTDEDDDAAALRLAELFGLSGFESELLVVAAGVEIDAGLRDAVASAQATPRGQPVRLRFATVLGLVPDSHWDALSPVGPLRHWSLVDVDASRGFLLAELRIDEQVLHYLTGVASFDERLRGLAHLDWSDSSDSAGVHSTQIALAIGGVPGPLVMLANALHDAAHKRAGRSLAVAVFGHLGMKTIWMDLSVLPGDPGELTDVARRVDREAVLTGSGIAVMLDPDPARNAGAVRLLGALRSPLVVLGLLTPPQLADLPARRSLRFNAQPTRALAPLSLAPAIQRATARALRQFRVEPSLLEQALGAVAGCEDDSTAERELWDALRESARGGLDALAQRVESRTSFDDLVVPSYVATQLSDIASQLRHRQQVYDEWGFGARNSRGLGIAALFAGESGTGKTYAAEAIANEARLDLYRIDLSSVVSKYIGETEKSLARLFEAAESSGAVLLFDEADALFGKRSEVKDSHDRYANIEVSYLLQRIEAYQGLAILTTNMKGGIDRAFLRRIRHVVQFPFPDERAREQIWRRQFPATAPVGELDCAALARLQLPGGNIRAVALSAAFRAAAAERPIDQAIVMDAARAEFARLERSPTGPLRSVS